MSRSWFSSVTHRVPWSAHTVLPAPSTTLRVWLGPSLTAPDPALDLLKGFEAAARHLSFTRAGEELFLTQSALSRQMQALEEQLGAPLFERRHRALRLTEAGQVLQLATKTVLDELSRAVSTIRRERSVAPLTISTAI